MVVITRTNTLLDSLREEWSACTFSDVRIVCSDGAVASHRLVLAATSKVLRAALLNTDADDMTTLMVPDVASSDLRAFLKRVYEGTGDVEQQILSRVQHLGFGFDERGKEESVSVKAEALQQEEMGDDTGSSHPIDRDESIQQFHVNKTASLSKVHSEVRSIGITDIGEKEKEGTSRMAKPFTGTPTDIGTPLSLKTDLRGAASTDVKKVVRRKEVIIHDSHTWGPDDPIWNFFVSRRHSGVAACKACNTEVNVGDQEPLVLLRHLEMHPHVLKAYIAQTKITLLPGSHRRASDLVVKVRAAIKASSKTPSSSGDPSARTCSACSKVFSCRASMQYHVKVVHSGERPFKCQECDATFARLDSFRTHSHTATRSFLCSVCGKTFARPDIRDSHERAHRGERRYACSFCEKRFRTNQQKTNHERVHTGEKPFQCTDCGRQFAQQHQLTTHTRIHTGEKPYLCPHCPQTFRHISTRNNHKCEGKTRERNASSAV